MNISRRGFLAGIGAGMAGVATGTGYRKLVPFVMPAEDIVPGIATWYASACRECPSGCGVLLRNREARIVKAEGNPLHPINQGRLCARGQASLQGLYDPDRIRRPRRRGPGGEWADASWDEALAQLGQTLSGARRVGVISDLQSGSLAELIGQWLRALRGSMTDSLVYEPFNYEPLRKANQRVFGRPEIPDYRIDRADLLISVGADFLETWLSPVQLTERFAEMRRVKNGRRGRFVYVGPRRSTTATQADHSIQVPAGSEGLFLRALRFAVDAHLGPESASSAPLRHDAARLGIDEKAIRHLGHEFREAKAPLILAGDPSPLGGDVAEAYEITARHEGYAGAGVSTIDFGRVHALSSAATLDQTRSFLERAAAGEFDVVLILNANPVYSLPPDLKAAEALQKAGTVICLNPFEDETVSGVATWALPANAPAESWGDFSPASGVHTLLQPAMGSLFQSRDAGDVLLQLAKAAAVPLQGAFGAESYYDYLRNRWQEIQRGVGDRGDFEAFWRQSVQKGALTVPAREAPAVGVRPPKPPNVGGSVLPKPPNVGGSVLPKPPNVGGSVLPKPPNVGGFGGPSTVGTVDGSTAELQGDATRLYVHPSLHFGDGRSANRSWLQEIPDPMTRAVWGSWVELHPETAGKLGVRTGDLVELATDAGRCELPAHVWDGVAPGTAALATGQGHTAYGRYAKGVGVNAFALLKSGAPAPEAHIRKLPGDGGYVRAHGSQELDEKREIIQTVAVTALASSKPAEVDLPLPEGYTRDRDVYEGHEHAGHRWAMAVDLDRCNGCNACVVACYAENNIPVVGKEEVRRSHEQPWLRIDRYDESHGEETRSFFQPMMCQQCDSAPCEPVCPVYAAVHGSEGLNEQVYNRCVGTRYCANNCPYKTRRFNWFQYEWPEPLNYQLNPDVTVRERGVMEKCSFCVQRIKEVTIKARAEGRTIEDGEITPACVQTCPANAIVFGDLMDAGSRITQIARGDARRYQVLRELNTKPAVFYLKKIVDEA